MTAKEKLGSLTALWIVYSIVTSGVMLFVRGFGVWSLLSSAVGLAIGLGIHVLVGRALLNRNGIVRGLLILISGVVSVLGVLALGKLALLFLSTWSFGLVVPFLAMATLVGMHVHSLRVLFDRSVRRYFR